VSGKEAKRTWASSLTRISLRFLSRPVILTLRYGSFLSKVVPLELTASRGEMRPASGCPYIWGSLPYSPAAGPLSGGGGTGEARLRVGMGELGVWGVVGHGGVSSPPKAAVELKGSNMNFQRDIMETTTNSRSGTGRAQLYYVKSIINSMPSFTRIRLRWNGSPIAQYWTTYSAWNTPL
jgi:hypothetical protein